jgi:hypothetical protein
VSFHTLFPPVRPTPPAIFCIRPPGLCCIGACIIRRRTHALSPPNAQPCMWQVTHTNNLPGLGQGVQKVFENVTVSRCPEFCGGEACGLGCPGLHGDTAEMAGSKRYYKIPIAPTVGSVSLPASVPCVRWCVCVGVEVWACVWVFEQRERVHFARVECEGPRHTHQKQLPKCTVDEGRRHVVIGTSRIESTYRSHMRAFTRHRLSWRSPSAPWSLLPNIETCLGVLNVARHSVAVPRSCLHCTVILRSGANVQPARVSSGHVHVCMAAARMPEAMALGVWSLWLCCIRIDPCMLHAAPHPSHPPAASSHASKLFRRCFVPCPHRSRSYHIAVTLELDFFRCARKLAGWVSV